MTRLRHALAALPALGLLAAGSCAEQGTELVLTIRTDFHVPEEVDELRLWVRAPAPPEGGSPYEWISEPYALGGDPGEHGMPATLALRPGPTYRREVSFEVVLAKNGVAIARDTGAASFREGERVDVEVPVDRVDSFACPNDPSPGAAEYNVGAACESSANCGGNYCLLETAAPGFRDGYCLGQTGLTASCSPSDNSGCVAGSKCIVAGASGASSSYLCLDACAVAGSNGLAHRTNCDCRDGYACDPINGVCLPGCLAAEDCCRVWSDADGDTRVDDDEWAPVDDCRGTCDPASFRCVYEGAPGAAVGDPCVHENDCPPDSRCLTEAAYGLAGGMCVRDRCDLDGHACDGGSGCVNLGYSLAPYWACVRGCELGPAPGEPGFRCEDGQACRPADFDPPPRDLRDADGYCWTGNWSSITVHNIYSPCTQPSDCWSPYGLGDCLQFAVGAPGHCVVHGCAHPDVAPACAEGGGGSCLADIGLDHCGKSCTPGVEPAASGCPAGSACWEYLGTAFCYLPCTGAAECGTTLTCNPVSHGCEV